MVIKCALTGLLLMALVLPAWSQAEKFRPHKNAPGPARLEVEKADNSGTVNTDIQFIADRQTIINHVTAYAYLIDEGRWERPVPAIPSPASDVAPTAITRSMKNHWKIIFRPKN